LEMKLIRKAEKGDLEKAAQIPLVRSNQTLLKQKPKKKIDCERKRNGPKECGQAFGGEGRNA